jgi:acyl-CoA thioesterase I
MMRIRIVSLLSLLLFSTFVAIAQIKVACVGNSITYGYGLKDREVNSYPAQLAKILGSEWEVQNFGVSASTLLRNGDRPYWKQAAFQKAKDYNPDVVIIKLGTNDTKPVNWKFRGEYTKDYCELIDTFRALSSKPVIFICYPVPAFPGKWGISDSIIRVDLMPMVDTIAQKSNTEIIDLYKPLSNHADLFPDKVHPNAEGAGLMAKEISAKLLNKKAKIQNRKK